MRLFFLLITLLTFSTLAQKSKPDLTYNYSYIESKGEFTKQKGRLPAVLGFLFCMLTQFIVSGFY
jgi:hypothetical protein